MNPAPVETFLQNAYAPLLVLHAAAAVVATAALTHNVVLVTGYLFGRWRRQAAERRFITLALAAYLAAFALGCVLYPTYRFRVRALVFDRAEGGQPWLAALFDIKENWASVALVALAAYWLLSRATDPRRRPAWLPLYALLAWLSAGVCWFNTLSGLYIVARGAAGTGPGP